MTMREQILAEARTWIGTPYRHQASLRGVGCDCLGLVRGVWRVLYTSEPEATPAYAPDWADLIWFPLVVIIQLIFTTGLALALSALTVHFRDIRDLLSNLLTFWFFATPIIYYYDGLNVQKWKWLFNLNPFFHLSVSYQEILFFPGPFVAGHLKLLLLFGAISIGVFFAGYWLFDRLRDSFAEVA